MSACARSRSRGNVLLLATLTLLAGSCRAVDAALIGESMAGPTVVIHTPGAGELGVATDYGVVFLARGARSGNVEFTVWFGDGPSLETGIIESVGANLYVTQAEILLPTTPLTFDAPAPGTSVLVRARDARGSYRFNAEVVSDSSVVGILLSTASIPARFQSASQVGAGVYRSDSNGTALIGLVSGQVRLEGAGGTREYLTVVGAADLWRLVAHDRSAARPRRPPHRGDIMP